MGNRVVSRCLLACIAVVTCAAVPAGASVYWARALGGASSEDASVIQHTRDGAYFVAGNTGTGTGKQAWAAKLDSTGKILWEKTYGGPAEDGIVAGQQTGDGGYILAGRTSSYGSGDDDGWIVKLDPSGKMSWQKTFGGTGHDEIVAIRQTADLGFICGGVTRSYGHGSDDAWVLRIDSIGTVLWQKAYGGTGMDALKDIVLTTGDGYLFAGQTDHGTRTDTWCVKLAADGSITWQRAYYDPASPLSSQAESVIQTSDGGYLVGAILWYDTAAVTSCLKIDSAGVVTWWNKFGGSCLDWIRSVRQDTAGYYLIAIESKLHGAGYLDGLFLKMDSSGQIVVQQTIGGSEEETLSRVEPTRDGGLVMCGSTSSFGAGGRDAFLIRASADGITNSACAYLTTVSDVSPTAYSSVAYAPAGTAMGIDAPSSTPSSATSSASLTNTSLCFSTTAPAITSITAKVPRPGQVAIINGVGFKTFGRAFAVRFGRKAAEIVGPVTSTSVKVTIPKIPKGWVGVTVYVNLRSSNTFPIQVR